MTDSKGKEKRKDGRLLFGEKLLSFYYLEQTSICKEKKRRRRTTYQKENQTYKAAALFSSNKQTEKQTTDMWRGQDDRPSIQHMDRKRKTSCERKRKERTLCLRPILVGVVYYRQFS